MIACDCQWRSLLFGDEKIGGQIGGNEVDFSRKTKSIYENRWVRTIKICLDKKFDEEIWWHRLHRSWCKRLLETALRPIGDELKQEQENALAYLAEEPIFCFFYGRTPVRVYVPDYREDLIQKDITMMQTFHEIELLHYVREHYLREGMVYMDCGANIGNHTLFFARVANAKKIFAFEGHPRTFGILNKNIELNALQNCVETYNCVLGEKQGRAKIQHEEPTNIGETSFCEDEKGDIKMICIDDITWTEKVDFVKMDVEGFEYHVLRGMRKVLQNSQPILWIESFPDKYPRVTTFLQEMGYRQEHMLPGFNYIFVHQ